MLVIKYYFMEYVNLKTSFINSHEICSSTASQLAAEGRSLTAARWGWYRGVYAEEIILALEGRAKPR